MNSFLEAFMFLISTATPDGGAAHGGERLPRQPHAGGDGGAAGDAGEEDGAERGVQRQLDRPHGQPAEGLRGNTRGGGHSPVDSGHRDAEGEGEDSDGTWLVPATPKQTKDSSPAHSPYSPDPGIVILVAREEIDPVEQTSSYINVRLFDPFLQYFSKR